MCALKLPKQLLPCKMVDNRRSCGGKSKKRKLLVNDDDIEVVSARTNKQSLNFCREMVLILVEGRHLTNVKFKVQLA